MAPFPRSPLWAFIFAGTAIGALIVAVARSRPAPATLDARAACSALLRAACERQHACPGCAPAAVDCGAVVAGEVAACERRAAPGEAFAALAVDRCVQAFAEQPCPMACGTSAADPEGCASLEGLSVDRRP